LEVEEPVELVDLAYKTIQPLPALIASRISLPYVRAIAILKDGIGLVIDPIRIVL